MNKIIEEDVKTVINSELDWGKFKNSTFFVTGSTGMIGSFMTYVLLYLNEHYNMNIDIILNRRKVDRLWKLFNGFDFTHGDFFINSSTFFDAMQNSSIFHTQNHNKFNNIDYIIHCASPASSQYYDENPLEVVGMNVDATRNLLSLATQKRTKGFLFFSSGEVCGKQFQNKKYIAEDNYGYVNPLDIRNCYAESKRMAEHLCKCYFHQYGVSTFIVRPDHTFGPTMDIENDERVFSKFVSNIVNGEDLNVVGDGSAIRTFTYMTDAVEGFFRVLLKGKMGEAYNVSNNDNRISIKDLAESLVKIYPAMKLKVHFGDERNMENKHKVQPSLWTKRIEGLGYEAKVGVLDGFRRVIEKFEKEKNDGYKYTKKM